MLLVEWVSTWIDSKVLNRAPSTINGYRLLCRKYLAGDVGRIDLDKVGTGEVIRILSVPLRERHSRAAQLLQIMLRASLDDAVRQRVTQWNPARAVDAMRHRKRESAWIEDAEQVRRVLADDGALSIAWKLAILCGLRRGELLGLRWEDIGETEIKIERQRVRVAGAGLVEQPPKSSAGRRRVPLTPIMVAALSAERESSGGAGYVLSVDGKPITDKFLRNEWRRVRTRCGVPERVTLHGLRHTFAALGVSAGVPVKALQTLMGHADFSTTANIYAHLDSRAARSAAAAIAAAAGAADGETVGARLEIV